MVVLVLLSAVSLGPLVAAAPLPAGWQTTAPATAHIAGVTMMPAAPHTLYAAGAGVYRSDDGGVSWTPLTTAFSAAEVQVAPSNSQILYAATGEGCASGAPGTLQRSADGGATWQPRTGGPASLVVSTTDADDLLGIGCTGVYRSTDGGQHWTLLPGSGVPNFDGRLLVRGQNDPAYLYAVFASEGGTPAIARSTDGGQTWQTQVLTDLPGPGDLVVDPQDARQVIFVSFAGYAVSLDAGATWTARNTGLPRTGTFYHLSTTAHDPATGTWYLGSADPTQPRGVFQRSAGPAWTAVTPAPGGEPISRLVFVPAGSGPALLAVTGTGALYRFALPGAGGLPGMPRTGGGAAEAGPEWALLGAALLGVGLWLRRRARQGVRART
jgi:photosystem II stability/assembly factor-like uncharacterized protein